MSPQSTSIPDTADDLPEEFWPDVDDLVTEDETPVDNIFSEKQQRLLTEPLYTSWPNTPFVAMANVGLFYRVHHSALVPDTLLSLGVEVPEDVWSKSHRAYFVWEFGKPPDVVIEVVSNKEGHEADTKLVDYANIGVKYYAIFDPEQQLSQRLFKLYELHGTAYVERTGQWLPGVELGLGLWEGVYEGLRATWLRWCDQQGNPVETGAERAEQEHERAEQEYERAEQEYERAEQERERAEQENRRAEQEREHAEQASQRAEQEYERAERMAQRLRDLGVEPDEG